MGERINLGSFKCKDEPINAHNKRRRQLEIRDNHNE